VQVEPNRVYIIPPNHYMGIFDNTLKLARRPQSEMPPLPIDFFLRTLAEDRGHNAAGIILSGHGSDGTLGLEAIKGADGITFAQDPNTAKFTGMPRSAMASGCVDFVLPPESIARELAKLTQHPYLSAARAGKAGEPVGGSVRLYQKVFSMLRSATGVDFAQYKESTLKRRIMRRMVVHRFDELENYVRFLKRNPREVQALVQDALITVTRFFREIEAFEALRKKVFPAFLKHRARRTPILIWVPGCSSGEEAYSIAMSLVEFLGRRVSDFPMQIFGTDISGVAIAKARAGVYRGNIALDVPPDRLRRFFIKTDDGYRIKKSIRDLCVFARQDLCGDPPFSKLDLISCQNLLIYLGPELQKKVIQLFHYALNPDGFLQLSPAEAISGLSRLFIQVEQKQKLYAKASPRGRPEAAITPRFFLQESEPLAPPERAQSSEFEQGQLLARSDEQPRARGGKRAGRTRLRAEATQINQLRRELGSTQESLQAIIEEREATKLARAQLAAIVESSLDAIIGKTMDGIISSWNKGAERMFGYSADEIVGRSISVLIPPDQQGELRQTYERLKRGEVVEPSETIRIRKDGRPLQVALTISPIKSAAGIITGASSIQRDITERKRLEAEVLRVSEREQQRIGHDLHDGLGQQLTAIELMCQSLRSDLAAIRPELHEQTTQICQFLREAITQTRALAHGLAPFKLDANGLQVALAELAQTTSSLKRVRCRFLCPATLLLEDYEAVANLYRIAQEAVHNAVKHGQANEVTIRLAQTNGAVQLRVSDDGNGLPQSKEQSEGMGLRVMKHRTSVIGADLEVESKPGKGVTVTCTLRRNESLGSVSDKLSKGLGEPKEIKDDGGQQNRPTLTEANSDRG
jgi:PAS domain S-box-containing protein